MTLNTKMAFLILLATLTAISPHAKAEDFTCGGWLCGTCGADKDIDETSVIEFESETFVLFPSYVACDMTNCQSTMQCTLSAGEKTVLNGFYQVSVGTELTIELPEGFGVNSSQQLTVGGEATREVSYESQVATTVGHCERCVGKVGPGYKTKSKTYEAMFRCYGLPDWCQVCKSELKFVSESLTYLVAEVFNGVECQQATPPNCPACNP